jgi:hypothetical protein
MSTKCNAPCHNSFQGAETRPARTAQVLHFYFNTLLYIKYYDGEEFIRSPAPKYSGSSNIAFEAVMIISLPATSMHEVLDQTVNLTGLLSSATFSMAKPTAHAKL